MRQLQWLLALFTVMAVAGCGLDGNEGADSRVRVEHDELIVDAAHGEGTRGFYFLPPMVPAPSFGGMFDASLTPSVVIDRIVPTTGATLQTLVTFVSGTGPDQIRVESDHYAVNWHTGDFDLVDGSVYRITVRVGSQELGFADVMVAETQRALKNVRTNENVPLLDGRTLPIKFRIEVGTIHCVDGATRNVACGLNGRGARAQTCSSGAWADSGPCHDPDECVDGSTDVTSCGFNGRGTLPRVCAAGVWAMGLCNDPDECTDGATREVACGPSSEGVRSETCRDGRWNDVASSRAIDVIIAVDNSGSMTDEIRGLESAINSSFASLLGEAGVDYRVVLFSRYGNSITAQSVCVSPPLSRSSCAPLGSQPGNNPPIFFQYSTEVGSLDAWCLLVSRFAQPDDFGLAPNGWSTWLRPEAFKHFVVLSDDNSQCGSFSGATGAATIENALATLSPSQFGTATNRNYAVHSIVGVQATPAGADPSVPLIASRCSTAVNAGAVHQQLSIDTGGMRYSSCSTDYAPIFQDLAARLIDQAVVCRGVDVCISGATRNVACGLNGRGSQPQNCSGGAWVDAGACQDADECVDGSTRETVCGVDDLGTQVQVCMSGSWTDGHCSQECIDGSTREVACPVDGGTYVQICTGGQWTNTAGAPIDVILAVDNSGSMTLEINGLQDAINSNFASLLGAAGVDYRVILFSRYGSSTSAQSVCVSPPLSSGSCSPPGAQPRNNPPIFFQYSTEVGSLDAWCLLATRFTQPDDFGLAPNGWSAWLRPEAFKHFVVLSDDNSQCNTAVYGSFSGATGAATIESALATLSPSQFGTTSARNYAVHSIVGVEATPAGVEPSVPLTTVKCSTAVNPGSVHQQLSIDTGGMRYPVCSPDYGAIFQDLAVRLIGQSLGCTSD